MEDDLKILEVEYLSNRFLNHTQTLNLSLYDQTTFYKSFKWRWPYNGRLLQNIKKWHISATAYTKIIYLDLDYQTMFYKSLKWKWPQV